MFVVPPRPRAADAPPPAGGAAPRQAIDRTLDPDARAALARLAVRTRPVAASRTRLLPVSGVVAGLLPDGALRRGSSLVVGGPGEQAVLSLALALVAEASRTGSWCALVGHDGLGAVAASDLGVDLDRLAVVPRPGPAWAETTATLIDGVDLVVLVPPFAPRPAMARRLVARARERGTVLVALPGRTGWPEPPDLRLLVEEATWEGTAAGAGHLTRRLVVVTAQGRRSAARARQCRLWLPAPDGTVAAVDAPDGTRGPGA